MRPKWCQSEHYRNHMNESIVLVIEHYRDSDGQGEKQCKINIRRDELGLRWVIVRLLLFFALAQAALVLLCLLNQIQIRLIWSPCLLIAVALLVFIFSPVIEESIILFDNLDGIEYEKRYLFGRHTSSFINTNRIIINEAITMQRVIFYLIAIPLCLQHLILNEEGDNIHNNKSSPLDEAAKTKLVAEAKLIPLFMHTLPRLDCLKVIYSYVTNFEQDKHAQVL